MNRCNNCGHLFEDGEADHYVETHGFTDGLYENWSCCPICGGDYSEAKPCPICGGYSSDADSRFCEDCIKTVPARFQKMVSENFTDDERELLNEVFGDDYF